MSKILYTFFGDIGWSLVFTADIWCGCSTRLLPRDGDLLFQNIK